MLLQQPTRTNDTAAGLRSQNFDRYPRIWIYRSCTAPKKSPSHFAYVRSISPSSFRCSPVLTQSSRKFGVDELLLELEKVDAAVDVVEAHEADVRGPVPEKLEFDELAVRI
jgi:hypothetical protein